MKKRKVNDEIHFMADNKPMKKTILGISTFEGTIMTLHSDHKLKPGVIKTMYNYGSYSEVDSESAFDTLAELKESLFGPTKD